MLQNLNVELLEICEPFSWGQGKGIRKRKKTSKAVGDDKEENNV